MPNLNTVWKLAAELARNAGLRDYGILVAFHRSDGFIVLVDDRNLEKLYTQWKCK